MRILTALGVYEDIQARVRQENAAAKGDTAGESDAPAAEADDIRGWFQYVSGMPGHEILHSVSPPSPLYCWTLTSCGV